MQSLGDRFAGLNEGHLCCRSTYGGGLRPQLIKVTGSRKRKQHQ
jgi:hypothetical protein